jgi:hypothetical protein
VPARRRAAQPRVYQHPSQGGPDPCRISLVASHRGSSISSWSTGLRGDGPTGKGGQGEHGEPAYTPSQIEDGGRISGPPLVSLAWLLLYFFRLFLSLPRFLFGLISPAQRGAHRIPESGTQADLPVPLPHLAYTLLLITCFRGLRPLYELPGTPEGSFPALVSRR